MPKKPAKAAKPSKVSLQRQIELQDERFLLNCEALADARQNTGRWQQEVNDWKANSQELSEHLRAARVEMDRMRKEHEVALRDRGLEGFEYKTEAVELRCLLTKAKSDHKEKLDAAEQEAHLLRVTLARECKYTTELNKRLAANKPHCHCWYCVICARVQSWIPWLKTVEEPTARH